MKILQVTPFFPPDIGGIADHVYNITTNLISYGEDVTVIAPAKLLSNNNSIYKFKTVKIPSIYLFPWPYPTLKNFGIPVDLGKKIRSVILTEKFDLVHCHGQHYPLTWITLEIAAKYEIPTIMTIHTTYGLNPYRLGGKTKIEEYFNRIIFSHILKKTDGIIGLTESNINYAKRYGSPSNSYFKISNGINTDLFVENIHNKEEYRRQYNIDNNRIVILFCGRFEHVKGIIEFAKAAKIIANNFSNIQIIIIGEGSLKEQVSSILRDVPNIRILGWQASNELYKIYILSDIFVIPSKYEGLPITLLEAMAASLEIVYTPVGSMPEVLKDYPLKTIMTKSDIDEIYNSLAKILTQPDDKNLRKLVIENNHLFDWKNIALQTKKAYEDIISKGQSN